MLGIIMQFKQNSIVCTVTSFRMKSLRVINYISYKVLTSREEFPDKQLSHTYLFSCDENKLKHPSCQCLSDHQADEGALKGCFTTYFFVNNVSHYGTSTHTGITALPTDSSPSPR